MLTQILSIHPETPTTVSFRFAKPEGFNYIAGQFINMELPADKVTPPGNKRNFSLSSSPTQDFLQASIHHGISPFKTFLETNLREGSEVAMTGPFGKFVLNEDPSIPAVFLTGGIGITPFHSMITYATNKQLPKPITLIYSNKSADDIAFKNELDSFVEKNPNLRVEYTVTQPDETKIDEKWTGRTGRIDEKMIREIVGDITKVEFYIVGPPKMVLDLKAQLTKVMMVLPERVHSELFTGY